MLDINDLAQEDIDQAEALLVQLIQDAYPSLDLSRGRVLRDLVIRPAAIFNAYDTKNMDELRRSMSLQQISSDPTLASDEIVDGVLSNLLLSRDTGANAAGSLRIIISSKTMTPIDAGAQFTANGLTFRTLRSFVGVVSEGNVVNTGSRLISQRADGNYEFIIDVTANAVGAEYNVADGTRFTSTRAIPRLIDIVAANDFSGGRTSEDNAALVAKVQNGIAPRVLSGRAHINALLLENFSNIRALSIIGYGDSEMRRDAHNLFGVGHGGKADIYVRSDYAPERKVLELTATCTDADTHTFTVAFDRDTAAGMYAVLAVYRNDQTPYLADGETEPTLVDSLEITSLQWSYDATSVDNKFVPELGNSTEAAFTRYSTAILQFVDSTATEALNATATYNVYVLRMPDIATIQDFVNDRQRRSPGTDYLVRAPIPAICTIGITVITRDPESIDTAAIKNAVANRVNSLSFDVGYLPSSAIVDAAQGQLSESATLDMPISMLAKVYLPDGTTKIVTGDDELQVPETDDVSVSTRTVAFFVRSADVVVAIRKNTAPGV